MFEVEWVTDVVLYGDNSVDEATYCAEHFPTREAAFAFARKVFPEDFYGSVKITSCHLESFDSADLGEYLVYDADTEHYEGE